MKKTLADALAEHRIRMKMPLHAPERTTTFFMFETYGGERVGFDPESLNRVLALFPVWDAGKRALAALGPSVSSRLGELEVSTQEVVFDAASGRIYSTHLKIQFGNGIVLRKRDAATGRACRDRVNSHEIEREVLQGWDAAEQVTVDRAAASGYDAATGRYSDQWWEGREPTEDELAGMTWWNSLSKRARELWFARVGKPVVADAWALLKSNPGIAFEVGAQEGQEIALGALGARN